MNLNKSLPTGVNPGVLAVDNGYIYTIGDDNNLYKLSTTITIPDGTAIPILDVSGAVGLRNITIYFNTSTSKSEMYISAVGNNTNGDGTIYRIPDLDNPILTIFASGVNLPQGLEVYNGYLYVITILIGEQFTEITHIYQITELFQFLLTDSSITQKLVLEPQLDPLIPTTVNQLLNPTQLVIVDNNLYILNSDDKPFNYIGKVDNIDTFSSSSSYNLNWLNFNYYTTNGYAQYMMVSDGTYLYFNYLDVTSECVYVSQVDIATATTINNNYFNNLVFPYFYVNQGVIYNNRFFIDFESSFGSDYDNNTFDFPVSTTPILPTIPIINPPPIPNNIPCFYENTQILTDKGYKYIKDLRKGDFIKTLKHDYKPIYMIGKKEMYHHSTQERIKNQLYKCSQCEYPEVFEDLIITGCHSILVDNFTSEEQKKNVIEVNGKICITDNKYRLPACADPRASVYEEKGTYIIYHIALENNDYYMNYGIYANGLLVETCSKRYLKELSNMTLID
jgi:hypothetical protein